MAITGVSSPITSRTDVVICTSNSVMGQSQASTADDRHCRGFKKTENQNKGLLNIHVHGLCAITSICMFRNTHNLCRTFERAQKNNTVL